MSAREDTSDTSTDGLLLIVSSRDVEELATDSRTQLLQEVASLSGELVLAILARALLALDVLFDLAQSVLQTSDLLVLLLELVLEKPNLALEITDPLGEILKTVTHDNK